MKSTFLAQILILVCSTLPTHGQTEQEENDLDTFEENFKKQVKPIIEEINKRKWQEYGDYCSYEIQTRKNEITKRLTETTIKNFAFSLEKNRKMDKFFASLLALVSELRDLPGELCNYKNTLQCNSTGRCDCADYNDRSLDLKMVRYKDVCRLAGSSNCAPDELLNPGNIFLERFPHPTYQCGMQSYCVVNSSGEHCNEKTWNYESGGIYRADFGGRLSLSGFSKNLVNEGLCLCTEPISTDGTSRANPNTSPNSNARILIIVVFALFVILLFQPSK